MSESSRPVVVPPGKSPAPGTAVRSLPNVLPRTNVEMPPLRSPNSNARRNGPVLPDLEISDGNAVVVSPLKSPAIVVSGFKFDKNNPISPSTMIAHALSRFERSGKVVGYDQIDASKVRVAFQEKDGE